MVGKADIKVSVREENLVASANVTLYVIE